MDKVRFEDYINRFNREDATAFDDYLTEDVKVWNGTLHYQGVAAMKAHYAKIWGKFSETIHLQRFVSDEQALAVQMWTHFECLVADENSLFGPIKAGEYLDFRGVVIYGIRDGKFHEIQIAYNSFSFTDRHGNTRELGIPH